MKNIKYYITFEMATLWGRTYTVVKHEAVWWTETSVQEYVPSFLRMLTTENIERFLGVCVLRLSPSQS